VVLIIPVVKAQETVFVIEKVRREIEDIPSYVASYE